MSRTIETPYEYTKACRQETCVIAECYYGTCPDRGSGHHCGKDTSCPENKCRNMSNSKVCDFFNHKFERPERAGIFFQEKDANGGLI